MTRTTFTPAFLALSLTVLGAAACSNPADGKAKAKVEEAKPVAEPAKTAAPPAGSKRFTVAPGTSKIDITASKPTRTHAIKVNRFTGTIDLADLAKPEAATVAVEIDAKSIEADDPGLTKHLLAKDFFWTEKYPTMKFVTTEIKTGGDKGATHTITGNLEMRGVTKSVTFPGTVAVSAEKVTLAAEFVINRKDWDIVYPGMADDLIRDSVVIKLDVNAPAAK
jgi:polyisoprenoid-binding protein YceI